MDDTDRDRDRLEPKGPPRTAVQAAQLHTLARTLEEVADAARNVARAIGREA